METRSKGLKTSTGNDTVPFGTTPSPPFKRTTLEELEREIGQMDEYDENDDESVSSLDSSESGTEYDSVNTDEMSPEDGIVEIPAEQREEENEEMQELLDRARSERKIRTEGKRIVRRSTEKNWQKINEQSTEIERRITRSMTEKEKKEEGWGRSEEPFTKVEADEFYAAMDEIEQYDEDRDEDYEMEDMDEESESETDYDSVHTEDLSGDEEME